MYFKAFAMNYFRLWVIIFEYFFFVTEIPISAGRIPIFCDKSGNGQQTISMCPENPQRSFDDEFRCPIFAFFNKLGHSIIVLHIPVPSFSRTQELPSKSGNHYEITLLSQFWFCNTTIIAYWCLHQITIYILALCNFV